MDKMVHFIERLYLRYDMIVTFAEYSELCKRFQGVFRKKKETTLGYVMVGLVKVWCLYHNGDKLLLTVYPPDIDENAYECIKSCFSRNVWSLALSIYKQYLYERKNMRREFNSEKEAAIYYLDNTVFSYAHIAEYRHGEADIFKLCRVIKDIMLCKSKYAKLMLVKK